MRNKDNVPLISIVMAAYNEERNIGKAIDSIINQTFSDWELIIVNDGSDDKTEDIIAMYMMKDKRIHTVRNKINQGLSASLNIGITKAQSDLIARADADDINMPDRLKKQYEYMQDHPEVDVIGAGAVVVDGQGKRRSILRLPEHHSELKDISFLKTHFNHSSVLIRKHFFDKAGMYNISYSRAQDKELWLRGLSAGCCYANLPLPLIEYHSNGYVRSWKSIFQIVISQLRMTKSYKIRYGYILVIISFVLSIATKLHIYKKRSLRGAAS